MKTLSVEEITKAFWEAEDEFGEHKSTPFLASITADRLGLSYEDVMLALWETREKEDETK